MSYQILGISYYMIRHNQKFYFNFDQNNNSWIALTIRIGKRENNLKIPNSPFSKNIW